MHTLLQQYIFFRYAPVFLHKYIMRNSMPALPEICNLGRYSSSGTGITHITAFLKFYYIHNFMMPTQHLGFTDCDCDTNTTQVS